MKNWFAKQPQEILQEFKTNLENGLTEKEVTVRQQKYGPNELIDRGTKSPWKIVLEQLTETMVVILIVSAIIMFFLHEYKDAIVILIIILLNSAGDGCTQENGNPQGAGATWWPCF